MNIDFATMSDILMLDQKLTKILAVLDKRYISPDDNWKKGKEVCKLLGCSPSSLVNYRNNNSIDWKKVGGTFYYKIKNQNNEN